MRFAHYALSLAERKLTAREIKSARGRERWKYTLEHLIGGTEDVTGFGELFIDDIRPAHVEAWRAGVARLIGAGTYAPTTANGWLVILRHILKRAKRELQLPFNAAEGVSCFDTSEHEVYTEEEPNALTGEETAAFLACMKESFPAQYAMAFLGIATGLRPSSMRPLRRQGPAEDGSFRSESFLKKVFPAVGQLIGLKKKFTPRGMRRTFNDLARVANVGALVTRSISGHLTEQMHENYSTVSPSEQRESVGRVLRLLQTASDGAAPDATGDPGMHPGSRGMPSRLGVR